MKCFSVVSDKKPNTQYNTLIFSVLYNIFIVPT